MAADAPGLPTVLVVDDDPGLLRLVQKALQRDGFSVICAASGREAIDWLTRDRADLMLLDLKLQDIEGKVLVNRLAEIGRSVPFLIITGQGDERMAVEMMKRGALDYLVKDVDFLQLLPEVVWRSFNHLLNEKKLRETEEALRESEERLRLAQSSAHVGIWDWHLSSGKLIWTAELEALYGYAPGAFPGTYQAFRELVHPDDLAEVEQLRDRAVTAHEPFDFDFRLRLPWGATKWVRCKGAASYDQTGHPQRVVGVNIDITDRKELEQRILDISEREQARIGQDLHDGLCQHLAGIEFRLLGLQQKLTGKSGQQAAETAELAKLVREGIEQTRVLAHGLSPVMLEPDGLMNALQQLAANTEKSFNITCAFNCPAPVLIHDNATAAHLCRIAQEAVHNAIRHGKAKFIVINLLTQNGRIVLGVRDVGIGLPVPGHKHQGMGLRIMQYRAGMVGGSLVVRQEPEGGTSVTCSLGADRVEKKSSDPAAGQVPPEPVKPQRRSLRRKDAAGFAPPRRGGSRKDIAPSS